MMSYEERKNTKNLCIDRLKRLKETNVKKEKVNNDKRVNEDKEAIEVMDKKW